jgi:hypothetical protein
MIMRIPVKKGYILSVSVVFLLFLLSPIIIYSKAHGQLIPLPSPDSANKIQEGGKAVPTTENQPPVIKFVTNILKTGNNVFKVTIADKLDINLCEVSYYRDGQKVTDDCIKDHNDLYKALIKMDSPVPHVIGVYARDFYGNSSTNLQKLIVEPQKNILEQIFDNLLHLF